MSVSCAERPGSSQGRGGNTQQEQKLLSSQSELNGINTEKELGSDSESILINRVLGEVLSSYSTALAEPNIVQLIRSYTSNDTSSKTRSKIEWLKCRLEDDQNDDFTRKMYRLTLNSKRKFLVKQQGTPSGTPESSEDEDCANQPYSHDYKIAKKIIKAEQVTVLDDKASQTPEKKFKNLKSPKDDELTELRRKEAQPGINTPPLTKPAAHMSTSNPKPPAAEVFKGRRKHQTKLIPTPTITKGVRNVMLKPSMILSRDNSVLGRPTTLASQPAVTASLKRNPVSMDGSELEEEDDAWCRWGSPLPSQTPSESGSGVESPKPLTEPDEEGAKPGTAEAESRTARGEKKRLGTSSNSNMNVGCLKGGSEKGAPAKKRKLQDVAGAKEESKSKDKPQDYKEEWMDKENGLWNLGNTCYLNAVLQCLSNCTALTNVLSNITEEMDTDKTLTTHLREVCREITRKDRSSPHSPSEIHEAILSLEPCSAWLTKQQQDVAELLQIVVSEIIEENSEIGKVFEGRERSLTRCKTCENLSAKEEKFTIITLDLDEDKEIKKMGAGDNIEKTWIGKMDSIEDLMSRYSKKEELRNDNKLLCTKCGKRQETEKNLEILEGPKVLLTQLKRYKKVVEEVTTKTGALPLVVRSTKMKQHITFHQEMSIPTRNHQGIGSKTERYVLRGFIVHYGENTHRGHYKAFVCRNNVWTEWNDTTGTIIPWKEIRTKKAYVLFWEKKEAPAPKKPAEDKDKKKAEKKAVDNRGPEEVGTSVNPTETEMDLDPDITKRKRENDPSDKTRDPKRKKEQCFLDKMRLRNSDSQKKMDALAESRGQTTTKIVERTLTATTNLSLEAVIAIVTNLREKVVKIEEKVKQLRIENTVLKGQLTKIRRLSKTLRRMKLRMLSTEPTKTGWKMLSRAHQHQY